MDTVTHKADNANSPYKGVRGGDPARRPPKYAVDYPCPNCRKTTHAVTDFGRPGKHVCADCRDARQRGPKCHGCGSRKGALIWNHETISGAHYNTVQEYYFHKHCLAEYKEVISLDWP